MRRRAGTLIHLDFASQPRWMFFRMAILVTLVLWLPDVYILHLGAPPRAVAVLMVMHLAIAVVTYTLLTRVAPVRRHARQAAGGRRTVIAGQED
jgi:hypothetical protein